MQTTTLRQKILLTAALAAVFLLALWLRMSSLDWGLPFRLHPDEWKYVSAGANCHRGEWNPKYFRNPPGFSYLNALWYPLWLKVRTPVEVPEWLGIDPQWIKPNDNVEATYLYRPFDLVLGGRALSAFLGALTCIAVFFLAWEWIPAGYALGAAVGAAVSFANVRESHFAVNDAAAACLAAWTLVIGVRVCRTGRLGWWCAGAALAGVSVAFKYNAFPAALALLAFRGLRFGFNRNEDRPSWAIRDAALIGTIGVLCFLILCPFPITDPQTFGLEMKKLRQASAQPWQGQDTRWAGAQLAETIGFSEGLLVTILGLTGLLIAIQKQRWTLLTFPVLYFCLIGFHRLYFVRFALPLLPWIAVWGAVAVQAIVERIRVKPRAVPFLAAGLFALGAIEPLMKDLRSNYLLKQTDTRIEFLHWLRTQERSKTFVAVDQFAIPLVYRDVAKFWVVPYDPRIVYIDSLPSDELEKLDTLTEPVNLIAVSDFATLPGYLEDTYLERREALRLLTGDRNPARVFQPFQTEWTPQSTDSEDAYSPFYTLWDRKQPGAAIEIYER